MFPPVSVKSMSPEIKLIPPEISPLNEFLTAINWNIVPRIPAVPKGLVRFIDDPFFNFGAFTMSSPKSRWAESSDFVGSSSNFPGSTTFSTTASS